MSEANNGSGKMTVSPDGMKQLLGYLINMKPAPSELREWVETWLDAWCPPPVQKDRVERINKLIGELENMLNSDAAWGEVRALLMGALVAAEATGAAAGHRRRTRPRHRRSFRSGRGGDESDSRAGHDSEPLLEGARSPVRLGWRVLVLLV
jgi:hypothetical protein